jgi:integrase
LADGVSFERGEWGIKSGESKARLLNFDRKHAVRNNSAMSVLGLRVMGRHPQAGRVLGTSAAGEQHRPAGIREANRGCRRAIKFHGLRHTCATLLLHAGEPVHVVSERLGHAKVSMTMEVYAHVLPDMQERAAEKMGTLLHG